MATVRFQERVVYQLAEQLADEIWTIVNSWTPLARNTMCETQHWLRRAFRRKLLTIEQVQHHSELLEALHRNGMPTSERSPKTVNKTRTHATELRRNQEPLTKDRRTKNQDRRP